MFFKNLINRVRDHFTKKKTKKIIHDFSKVILSKKKDTPSVTEITVENNINIMVNTSEDKFSMIVFALGEYKEFTIFPRLLFYAKKNIHIYIICDKFGKKGLSKDNIKKLLANKNTKLYEITFDTALSILLEQLANIISTKYIVFFTGNTVISKRLDLDIKNIVKEKYLLYVGKDHLDKESESDYSFGYLSGAIFDTQALREKIHNLDTYSRFWVGRKITNQYTQAETKTYKQIICKKYHATKYDTLLFAYIIRELLWKFQQSQLQLYRPRLMQELVSTVHTLLSEKKLSLIQKALILSSCILFFSINSDNIPDIEKWKQVIDYEFDFDELSADKNIQKIFKYFTELLPLRNIYDIYIIENAGINDIKNSLFFSEIKKQYKIKYTEKLINFDYYHFNNMIIYFDTSMAKVIIGSGSLLKKMLAPNIPHLTLWHGLGLMKETIFEDKKVKVGEMVCSSKACEKYYAKHFHTKKVMGLGAIQTDLLFNKEYLSQQRRKIIQTYKLPEDATLVFFAPTFRFGEPHYYHFMLDVEDLATELAKHNIFMLVKRHYVFDHIERKLGRDTFGIKTSKNRHILLDKKNTFMELISACDIFMTDYSSGLFYATVRNLPLILYAPDLEEYKKGPNGLILDYPSEIPAVPILEPDAALMIKAFLYPPATDTEAYRAFKEKHIGSCDGQVYKRVLSYLNSTLQKAGSVHV